MWSPRAIAADSTPRASRSKHGDHHTTGSRKLTKRVLEVRGYAILAAWNGVEAWEIVAQHPRQIHLMITDEVMPG